MQAIAKLVVESCLQGTSKDCFFVTPAHDSMDGGGRAEQEARAEAGVYTNQWLIDSGLRQNDIIRDSLQRVLCADADNALYFSKFVLV